MADRTLPARIAARPQELIVDGTYPSGSRLPRPADLATEFGVTTIVVGEAVALLVSACRRDELAVDRCPIHLRRRPEVGMHVHTPHHKGDRP
jgi:hypothetical protein